MLDDAGLAIWNEPVTRDLTGFMSTRSQYRAQADFDFGYKDSVEYDFYTINQVNASGVIYTPAGNEIEIEEFTVNKE